MIWGAGVRATALTARLGAPLNRAGHVLINRDLTLPGYHNAFAIGDMTYLEQDGKPLPGVSPVAMQMGRCVARNIKNDLAGKPYEEFRYLDKRQHGDNRTQSRNRRVGQIALERVYGVDGVAVGSHLLPDRLPQSFRGDLQLGVVIFHLSTRRAVDHRKKTEIAGCRK